MFGVLWLVLAIAPSDRMDWLLENGLTAAALPLWLWASRRLPLSDRAWIQATLFLALHTVGSHWTYSEVPAGDWVKEWFDLSRNHYDRLVHFSFGLLMLRPMRELIIHEPRRFSPSLIAYLCVSGVVVWSALYEILEWVVAASVDPTAGLAYVGTQGDPWDAQKDMGLAFLGALIAAAYDWRGDRVARRH
ncbi:MAG: DUF2238 domain-containing protein [bacterium]